MSTFEEQISRLVKDIRRENLLLASTKMSELFTETLLQNTSRLDLSDRFDLLVEDATLELVLHLSEQTGAGVHYVVSTIDHFMSAHVKPMKDHILNKVKDNLSNVKVASNHFLWAVPSHNDVN
jgi:hypothetical protein